MKLTWKKMALAAALTIPLMAGQCTNDATTVNQNLSTEAENFKLLRNIVFYNTWTDTEVVSVTGFCNIDDFESKLWVTCRDNANGESKRHQMGRSANMTYFMTQLDGAKVSAYHTKIIWKPQSFIPDIDVKVDVEELFTTDHIDN